MQSFTPTAGGRPGDRTAALAPAAGRRGATREELRARVDQLEHELAALRRARNDEQAENELLGQRLQRLLEVLPAGVVVLDGRGRVTECNPAAQTLLGDAARPGCLWRELVATAFAPRPDDGPDVSLASGRRVTISTRSLETAPGQIVLLTDVTESRELRETLARMQRRAAVGGLAATLAHQVRTPLATALLHAGTLRNPRAGAEERTRAGERITERLRHLERLVEDMLHFSRRGSFELEPVAVGDLLDELARGRGAAHQGFTLELPAALRELPLAANLRALASAFDNLVGNAFEAGAASVRVSARAVVGESGEPGGLTVEVADDGPGMSPEVRDRAFEPFFTTRGRGRGTGLGLAIAQAVIEAHAGDIALHTVEGGGCRFCITLPAA